MTLFDNKPLTEEEVQLTGIQLEMSLDELDDDLVSLEEARKIDRTTMQLEFTV